MNKSYDQTSSTAPTQINLIVSVRCPDCDNELVKDKGVYHNGAITTIIDDLIIWDPHDQDSGYIQCSKCGKKILVHD